MLLRKMICIKSYHFLFIKDKKWLSNLHWLPEFSYSCKIASRQQRSINVDCFLHWKSSSTICHLFPEKRCWQLPEDSFYGFSPAMLLAGCKLLWPAAGKSEFGTHRFAHQEWFSLKLTAVLMYFWVLMCINIRFDHNRRDVSSVTSYRHILATGSYR